MVAGEPANQHNDGKRTSLPRVEVVYWEILVRAFGEEE
jgi:hypothetical protein